MRVVSTHWPVLPRLRMGVSRIAASIVLAVSTTKLIVRDLEPRMSQWLAQELAARVPRSHLDSVAQIQGIIVLGGSKERVKEALTLAQRYKHATLVLSGPGDDEIQLAVAQLGKSRRLQIDRRATNTFQNALYSQDVIVPGSGSGWIMVTSAIHMPRAFGVFQALGLPILPYPIFDTPLSPELRSATVRHELLGLAGYWLLGRTLSIFPSHSRESVR